MHWKHMFHFETTAKRIVYLLGPPRSEFKDLLGFLILRVIPQPIDIIRIGGDIINGKFSLEELCALPRFCAVLRSFICNPSAIFLASKPQLSVYAPFLLMTADTYVYRCTVDLHIGRAVNVAEFVG